MAASETASSPALFILTGDIQTGKTRWLCSLVERIAEAGVTAEGVIAPGRWREREDGTFEKLGIDNRMLPQGDQIPFALRRDLAEAAGLVDPESQSEKARLGWYMDDGAVETVNRHLATLRHPRSETASGDQALSPRLLVVDELGTMELVKGTGLTEAMALLDEGPNAHRLWALIVARPSLSKTAACRFQEAWGPAAIIHADSEGESQLLSALGLDASDLSSER